MITSNDIIHNPTVRTYIQAADKALASLGYTEHSYPHTVTTALTAYEILIKLGYDERTADLAKIAGYMHDIGNVINRADHAHSSALMSFRILSDLGMDAEEVVRVISAIGSHDEKTAYPVNEIAAALILADKSDVRRSRVRNTDLASFDIHDRVNYAVETSDLVISPYEKTVTLILKVDLSICSVLDYFEIFLDRMLICKAAAAYLGLQFKIRINESNLI